MWQFLEGCIEKQPDILLEELQTRLREVCEVDVSLNTIKETLRRRGFTRKLVSVIGFVQQSATDVCYYMIGDPSSSRTGRD
jgi:hypothetical protein